MNALTPAISPRTLLNRKIGGSRILTWIGLIFILAGVVPMTIGPVFFPRMTGMGWPAYADIMMAIGLLIIAADHFKISIRFERME